MLDKLGNTVGVGDRIAVAMREGNTASIRVGIVKSIEHIVAYGGRRYAEAKVEWEMVGLSYTTPQSKTTKISLDASRVVKI